MARRADLHPKAEIHLRRLVFSPKLYPCSRAADHTFPVTYFRVAQLDAEVWTSEKGFRTLLALLSIIRYAAYVEAIGEEEEND
jgi:hypothetical protein